MGHLPSLLLANNKDVPQNLIDGIVYANRTRNDFVADQALPQLAGLVCSGAAALVAGVRRFTMKTSPDSSRVSSVVQLGRIVTDGRTSHAGMRAC